MLIFRLLLTPHSSPLIPHPSPLTPHRVAITVNNTEGLDSSNETREVATPPVPFPQPPTPTISDITNVSAAVSWTATGDGGVLYKIHAPQYHTPSLPPSLPPSLLPSLPLSFPSSLPPSLPLSFPPSLHLSLAPSLPLSPDEFPDFYILQYKRRINDWSNNMATATLNLSSTVLSQPLAGLEPLTSYDVRMQSQNVRGLSTFSSADFETVGRLSCVCMHIHVCRCMCACMCGFGEWGVAKGCGVSDGGWLSINMYTSKKSAFALVFLSLPTCVPPLNPFLHRHDHNPRPITE